ncbi:MAG: leucine-rich repeat domain-containing protein, partial [Clostridia bacterium]|nr:leucine-rich repeat domain-containing protein [Clostridia bacterium]
MKRVLAFLICALLLLSAMAEDVGQVYTLGPYSFERLPDSDDIAIVGYDGEVERLNVPAAIGRFRVVAIGENAFAGRDTLVSVTLPSSVVSIGAGAFADCPRFESLNCQETLDSIGDGAFAGCTSLKQLVLPQELSYLGAGAFYRCESLEEITLSLNLTEIGADMFFGCRQLAKLELPSGVTRIGPRAFAHCESLASILLPEGLSEIGEAAFACCYELDSLRLPENVRAVSEQCFSYCVNLKEIALPQGLESIGAYAFWGCEALDRVVIPGSVTEIGDRAFQRSQPVMIVREEIVVIEPESAAQAETESTDEVDQPAPETDAVQPDAGEETNATDETEGESFVEAVDEAALEAEEILEEDTGDTPMDITAYVTTASVGAGTVEITSYNGSFSRVSVPEYIGRSRVIRIGSN